MKDNDTEHGARFEFNENVAECFSNMLERSIPSYDLMRELMISIIESHIIPNSLILDIGTSNGESLDVLSKKYKKSDFIGLDISDSMIEKAKTRFADRSNVDIRKHDLRNSIYVPDNPDIIISCLTIQFTPIEYRLQILQNIHNILADKGMFIFVEKVLGSSAQIDKLLVDIYYSIKLNNGYSYDEIKRKKLALEGVLVPVTAKWNEELLSMSGFNQVECFWRCLNFAGWVAYK